MRKFDEKELVSKLDKILKKEFGTNLAFHEFSAGYGIADLVFAQNFSFKKDLLKRIPLTNFNSLKLLLTLEEQKVYEFSDLMNIFTHLNTDEVKRQIRLLVANQFLKKVEKNNYVKVVKKDSINPIKKIVAVEVKLNDHRGGLTQARRYQYFADESYLAILKEAEKNIDFAEFNKHNIGLILFDNSTNTIEIRYPQQTNYNFENTVSLFAKEMMLSKYINFAF